MAAYERFRSRLSDLRTSRGVSAKSMSLQIGKSANYICSIESGKTMPSMDAFLEICDFLEISPAAFFDFEMETERSLLYKEIADMDDKKMEVVKALVGALKKL